MSDEKPTIKAFQKRINPETGKEEILLFLHEPVESYDGKEIREMTEDEEEIKAAGDEAYDDLISYERLTGTM